MSKQIIKTPTGRTQWPDGSTPSPDKDCEWVQEKNPNAGSAEADWWWVEYKIVTKEL